MVRGAEKGKRSRQGGQASNTQSPARGAPTQLASSASSVATVAAAAGALAADAEPQRPRRSEEYESFLERVRKQVEFYFSEANLRRDQFLRRKIKEGSGHVQLAVLLTFNRMRALHCFNMGQLVQAIRKSEVLVLSEDKTTVARNTKEATVEDGDPASRIIYVEGLPITFGIDDLTLFFARHGRVYFVELPRHCKTREPRGFCFVEYASNTEAEAAVTALNGTWPSGWPARMDGKALRVMPKTRWKCYKKEFQVLQSSTRRGLPEQVHGAPPGSSASAVAATSSTTPAGAAPAASSSAQPRVRRGCLLLISGFAQTETRISLRQFMEHAVPVEFCDFEPGDSQAYVRLRCPEDCHFLLQDLELTDRELGWLSPQVSIVPPDEEERYWQEVAARRASRPSVAVSVEPPAAVLVETAPDGESAGAEATPRRRTRRRRQSRPIFPNPQGVIVAGPVKTTTINRFRAEPEPSRGSKRSSSCAATPAVTADISAASTSHSGSFVDTAGGCSTFGQAGFGKPRSLRKSIFGSRARKRKASGVESPALRPGQPQPMPRGMKNLWIAPPTHLVHRHSGNIAPGLLKRAAGDIDPELGPPLSKESKIQRPWTTSVPPRLGASDTNMSQMQFPPPSPVAVQQAPAKRKQVKSPIAQPVRRPATGLVPLLLPPPSPIARPPDERRPPADTPVTGSSADVTGAAGLVAPIAGDAAAMVPGAGGGGTAAEEVPPQKEIVREKESDSMLDKIDLDELESLLDD